MRRFWKDGKGQGLVEYAMVLGLVVMVGVAILLVRPDLRDAISHVFQGAQEQMEDGEDASS